MDYSSLLVLVKAVELEIREHPVRAGQLHWVLEREVGQTLDPAELVLASQLLVERLNVDLEADVFPKPLCPGCGDEGGLLQVGVELAVALALGPQLHAELDGQTPGQKPSCADATSSPPLRSFQSNTRQTCTKMIKVSTSGKENSRIRIRCPFL